MKRQRSRSAVGTGGCRRSVSLSKPPFYSGSRGRRAGALVMIEMALTQARPPREAFLAREKIPHEPRGGAPMRSIASVVSALIPRVFRSALALNRCLLQLRHRKHVIGPSCNIDLFARSRGRAVGRGRHRAKSCKSSEVSARTHRLSTCEPPFFSNTLSATDQIGVGNNREQHRRAPGSDQTTIECWPRNHRRLAA
jgi:hypothetical protein